MEHSLPYDPVHKERFWRSAVADIRPETELFRELIPRLPIDTKQQLSSAGSCFAQHIGNWLEQHNYSYLRSELNPDVTSSFAFGNLYNARALLQWFIKGEQELAQYSIYFDEENQRYYDLLLPKSKEGYSSREALLEYRRKVVAETKRHIAASNSFIFTLGLIETWVDPNGVCYPSCPGVKLGEFDPDCYRLKVFDYEEVYIDLDRLLQQLKCINPKLKLILTVSPVPLTATATEEHVLVANGHSKSVLRAVAGSFCKDVADASYFPSYELITTSLPADFRFLDNRRTVSKEGVGYVMRHWSKALACEENLVANHLEADCDEELLDALQRTATGAKVTADTLTLIGDSHMGKLAKAFEHLGQAFCGGMVMNGSGFAQHKFVLSPESDIMVPLESADSRKLWQPILANLDALVKSEKLADSVVLTNIGLQTHQTVSMFIEWMRNSRAEKLKDIELSDYVDFFNEQMQEQMTIVFRLKEHGHRVVVISDTPFVEYFEESKSMAPFVMAYMDAMEYVWDQMGVEFLHAARHFNETITDPLAYASELVYADGQHDWFHGGAPYYDWLARQINALL
ncbi:GSCFA domain-containing protein [Shewanella algae]|uniref:GSCFA domain-containing protein n=1 Tax=Shewanella algae TaxID=38313 RepID=UPI001AAC56FD|nr:GSCFA domain-containing protein [Shewanella algae]MBO2604366.1 GSCFA domain-containing protein [Shewanella algae]